MLVRPFEDPDRLWPIYGVSNKRGVILNEHRLGSAFRAPQKRIEKDWFFHNPTRANVGSLGRVGEVEADAVTSPEYQVWKIDADLLPAFMELVLKFDLFREQVEFNRVGSVKERLFVDNLLDIAIPVPSLSRQQDAVDHVLRQEIEAHRLSDAADEILRSIDVLLLRRLGLDDLRAPSRGKVSTIRRHAMDRWGVAYNQIMGIATALENGRFEVRQFGGLLTALQYGLSVKTNAEKEAGLPVLRMGNLADGEIDVSNLKYVDLPQSETASYLLSNGDILINRTNSKELVGKAAVFHEPGDYLFASYLLRARCDAAEADPDYLALVLNSPIGRRQIDRLSRQALGMANINSQEIRALRVPLPPLEIQASIADEATSKRADAAELIRKAQAIRTNAVRDIEQALVKEMT